MTEKTAIVAHLGESAVLLPQLLSQALDTNERAKLRMTVLQDALAHAEQPSAPVRKLHSEGRVLGLDDVAVDATVSGARLIDSKQLALPGGKTLIQGLCQDIEPMAEPLKTGDPKTAEAFSERLDAVGGGLSSLANDLVPRNFVGLVTSAKREGRDTAHLLVMDLHRAINRLSAIAFPPKRPSRPWPEHRSTGLRHPTGRKSRLSCGVSIGPAIWPSAIRAWAPQRHEAAMPSLSKTISGQRTPTSLSFACRAYPSPSPIPMFIAPERVFHETDRP